MKKLILILLFSTVMFSSSSYAEWTKVSTGTGTNNSGSIFYVDFERIRKHDGYVYYWELEDYLKPDQFGMLSSKLYYQGDCKLFRYKILSYSFHKEPMGDGTGEVVEPTGDHTNWKYPPPNSAAEITLKSVCNR